MKNKVYFQRLRPELLSFIPKNAKIILEIGCAGGVFGKALRTSHSPMCLDGIELVPGITPPNVYDDVYVGGAEEILPQLIHEGKKYDTIICADILEHLIDPWKTLADVTQLLIEEGQVVLSIPNVRSYTVIKNLLFLGKWEYGDEGPLDKTHLRFFTRSSIQSLLTQTNLEIVSESAIRTAPASGWKRFLHQILTSSKRFKDLSVYQFIIVARKSA